MFGLYRTTLAVMVMVHHLFLGFLPLGTYPVFGFYIISGYLMTLIMHETYGYTSSGRFSFAINRILRLYPQYLAAALISIILILILGPEFVKKFHGSMFMPSSTKEALFNFLILFHPTIEGSMNPRLVPPTWALTIEIFFYILICIGISKNIYRIYTWIFVSIIYVFYSFIVGWPWQTRYFTIAAASLPFSIGSAIYFISKNTFFTQIYYSIKIQPIFLFLLMLLNVSFWSYIKRNYTGYWIETGFYLNLIICSLIVYSLSIGEKIFNINKYIDKIIGNYSYPIYILHWQCGLIVSFLMLQQSNFNKYRQEGLFIFILSVIFVLFFSFLFIRYIDEPIQHIRIKIKKQI
ncbi:acyltransferase 3 [Desulfobulbus propionicus DSM 2032]|uniref:Acyltransferase 3 n=2 Tax=Desulfobulbus propionicus TaxID=894 RepID=A0A7U3YJV2_DESPD|nr:acyltransferase 3 [Desulfobulbus propionicus DSM 2032]